ncbi:MAG TPA: class I SAM-dependent methyltransferase [Gemmatimonadaceae bacterium]|nr:class I SAM-dependent methyltransferase [Gemmatimonadaceae bacterium]
MGPLARAIGFVHSKGFLRRRVRALSAAIAPLLPRSARVLDVGCGDGLLAAELLGMRPDLRIEGVDVLVRDGAPVPIRQFDGQHLPYSDVEFDVSMAIDVFHHAAVPEALMAEMKRVSRDMIVIKDHLAHGLPSRLLLRAMDWVGNAPHGVRLPYNYWTEPQWRAVWARTGLQPTTMIRRLNLYAFPLSVICDADLHFLATLEGER